MMRQQNQLVNEAFSVRRGKFVIAGQLARKKALEMNTLRNFLWNSTLYRQATAPVFFNLFTILLCGFGTSAWAQDAPSSVERTVKSAPNKDTRIGLYLNVLPDCT